MPTASSAHMRRKIKIVKTTYKILTFSFLTFFIVISIPKLKKRRRNPITTKSKIDQFTSSVNCIANKGIINSNKGYKNLGILNF